MPEKEKRVYLSELKSDILVNVMRKHRKDGEDCYVNL